MMLLPILISKYVTRTEKRKIALLTDIQPPSIQCPPNMETPTAAGKSYAIVTWQVPVPTDNSKGPLNLSGLLPPQRMNVGTNLIRYDVTDSEGLKVDCVFSIRVKGELS